MGVPDASAGTVGLYQSLKGWRRRQMISIIVPAYNVEAYLPRCVDSILAQTCPDWELILVNDGSKDGTGAVIDEYAAKDTRIRAVHKKNGGVSSARNKGMELMQGEYVIFIDSDDWLEPDMLKELEGALSRNQSDMAACDAATVMQDENGELKAEISYKWGKNAKEKTVSGKDAFYAVFYQSATLWNKLFRTDTVRGIAFNTKMSYGEDTDFLLRAMQNCSKLTLIPYCGYNYFFNRTGNVRSAKIDARSMELLNNARIVYQTLCELGYASLGVYRLHCVIWQVICSIPTDDYNNPEYQPYLKACRAAARTASVGDVLKYLADGIFPKNARMRYLYFYFSPKAFVERRRKQIEKK